MGHSHSQILPQLGVYLHVPFCATACSFCAFYQEAPRRNDIEAYLDAMQRELQLMPPKRPVRTVFWGGGTPGLLPARDLERLGRIMQATFPEQEAPEEWTVEMAPSSVKADKIAVLRELGVTRISMGIQTFQPHLLEALGRQHSPQIQQRALDTIKAEKFRNFNIDLMFALPGQHLAEWVADLRQAVELGSTHISTYCLTFEEDTALYARMLKGDVKPLSPEEEREYYLTTWRVLDEAGFQQYEISNYARPGYACQHNLDTWAMQEWLGYGPSAASQYRAQRWSNVASLKAWQDGLSCGASIRQEIYPLNDATLAADSYIFGLRMNSGVLPSAINARFPLSETHLKALDALWADLESEGYLDIAVTPEGSCLKLTAEGRLVVDRIGSMILELL